MYSSLYQVKIIEAPYLYLLQMCIAQKSLILMKSAATVRAPCFQVFCMYVGIFIIVVYVYMYIFSLFV